MDTLVLATRNPHKTEEIRAMLTDLPITIRDLTEFPDCPEVEEDGRRLEDNALKKALSAYRCTGLPVIADDTGLEVYYLLNAPGVYSARYAGEDATYEDNNDLLLKEMKQVPPRRRQARFRCVVALVGEGFEQLFEGKVEGDILRAPRGDNGFGYDPLFRPEGEERSFAQLSAEEKNSISHRALAIRRLKEYLQS
ncbi:MAG: RdgB/HAM1 family non-canonical purine NTP pyrophosphatase [Bacteroidota bacterium]|nr:RdgB/HAM1 family non-canonical purine NTP pyrophosphatase [Bacteroidota bacterium]